MPAFQPGKDVVDPLVHTVARGRDNGGVLRHAAGKVRHAAQTGSGDIDALFSEDADEVLFVIGDDLSQHEPVVPARGVRLHHRRQPANGQEGVEQF